MAGTRHDPDAELIAQGVGNMLVPFFGGIPATGAIARTATNVRSGGRTPVASMAHALTILVGVLAAAPLLGFLPMTSLAALLLLVAWNMSEARHFVHILRVAPKSDVVVLLTCFSLTVAVDMVVGVSVGMVLAAFLFMRRMAEVTESQVVKEESHSALTGPIPPGVQIYAITGPLFFGAAQKAMAALRIVGGETRAVILLLDEVHAMDATGLVALESAVRALRQQGCAAILAGVRPQPLALLNKAGFAAHEGAQLCASVEEAFALIPSPPPAPSRSGT